MRRSLLLTGLAVVLGAGAFPGAPAEARPVPGITSKPTVSGPADARVAQVINRVRQRHGLRPLRVSQGISVTARPWARHLSAMPQRLVHDPGYWSDINRSCRSPRSGAENVAYRYDSRTSRPLAMHRRSAIALVRMYLGSPPHRANILNPDSTHLGTATVMRRTSRTQVYTTNVMRFARAGKCR